MEGERKSERERKIQRTGRERKRRIERAS